MARGSCGMLESLWGAVSMVLAWAIRSAFVARMSVRVISHILTVRHRPPSGAEVENTAYVSASHGKARYLHIDGAQVVSGGEVQGFPVVTAKGEVGGGGAPWTMRPSFFPLGSRIQSPGPTAIRRAGTSPSYHRGRRARSPRKSAKTCPSLRKRAVGWQVKAE